jgi:hypothetical protein
MHMALAMLNQMLPAGWSMRDHVHVHSSFMHTGLMLNLDRVPLSFSESFNLNFCLLARQMKHRSLFDTIFQMQRNQHA